MTRIALVGNKYGRLTVIEDSLGMQVVCRCDCGAEALYTRLISKPGYRHSRMCKDCLTHPCDVCGKPVYKSNKATCSIECHRERNRRREKERYERVRHTDRWKKVRADYLARLKVRMDADPDFKARYVEARRLAVRKHFLMLRQNADRFAAHLDDKRKRERIRSQNPVIQHRKAVYRTIWYHTMSAEDYQRIFVESRHAREKAT